MTTQKSDDLILCNELPEFVKILEDLSPFGCILLICDTPYRAMPNDAIYIAIQMAAKWKEYEVSFSRIHYLSHWINASQYFLSEIKSIVNTMHDAKLMIDDIICSKYANNEEVKAKYQRFNSELFSIQYNNYQIGGKKNGKRT